MRLRNDPIADGSQADGRLRKLLPSEEAVSAN
jgi:hypothetical protein